MPVKPWFPSCRLVRRLEWTEAEDGRILVFRPRFGESALGRKFASWLGLSDYRIRLDEIGTLVWKQCDGRRPASQIADALRKQFGERIEPAEDRLQTFVFQMSRARMIAIEVESKTEPDEKGSH